MKCPHCLVEIHPDWNWLEAIFDGARRWSVSHQKCPACAKCIIKLSEYSTEFTEGLLAKQEFLVWPRGISRAPVPKEVPDSLAKDYKEACLVLADSQKASAALSRGCLQNLLRDYANVKHSDLADEINQVLTSNKLPSHLAQGIDAVRALGNFAAHPIKSKHTGEIVPVEPGEAEWLLDILEGLFDFYFVQPAILQAKRDALNKKLKDAGKPELK